MMIKSSFFHKKELLSFDYANDPVCFAIGMLLATSISMKIIMAHITFIKFCGYKISKSSLCLIVVPFKVITRADLPLGANAGMIKRCSSELREMLVA